MTGVNGREELIFEGSNDKINWFPYEFYYKPGSNLADNLAFTGPH